MTDKMPAAAAHEYAASWGSMMTAGDPGACMYGFDEKFLPQSEEHRTDVRNWIERECRPCVVERPAEYDDDELAQMDSFLAALAAAPLADAIAEAEAKSNALLADADEFTLAYIEAALFTGVEFPEGHPDASHDKDYSRKPADIEADTLAVMIEDCRKFQTPLALAAIEAAGLIGIRDSGATPLAQAGHDFWFTRNGHGVGFWDGDWPEPHASFLDKHARFGEFDLYTADDGRVCSS